MSDEEYGMRNWVNLESVLKEALGKVEALEKRDEKLRRALRFSFAFPIVSGVGGFFFAKYFGIDFAENVLMSFLGDDQEANRVLIVCLLVGLGTSALTQIYICNFFSLRLSSLFRRKKGHLDPIIVCLEKLYEPSHSNEEEAVLLKPKMMQKDIFHHLTRTRHTQCETLQGFFF